MQVQKDIENSELQNINKSAMKISKYNQEKDEGKPIEEMKESFFCDTTFANLNLSEVEEKDESEKDLADLAHNETVLTNQVKDYELAINSGVQAIN
jgi:hypothetical protein